MASLNKMMVIGNLGTDPEMRYTPSGAPVTSFRIAVNRTYTSGGERREETEWFTVKAWNQLGETVNQFLTKGRQVYVEGRLNSRSWAGQDGQLRFTNEITANQVLFLNSGGPSVEDSGETVESTTDSDDLPW